MSLPRGTKSSQVRLPAAAAVVVFAVAGLAGCGDKPGSAPAASSGSSSAASPAASSTGSPAPAVTGETVKQIPLDGADLTAMLAQPFKQATGSPVYGGVDAMEDPATPGDCVGVVNAAPRRLYEPADVQSYTRQTWIDAAPRDPATKRSTAKVMFVTETVVALPSNAAAQALFAKFADQWKQCEGQAVNQAPEGDDADSPHLPGTEMHIADVRVSDAVLAASIVLDKHPAAPDTRAVGVQGNCLVGVLVAFTGTEDGTGSGDPATTSSAVVRAMMDRVSKLS